MSIPSQNRKLAAAAGLAALALCATTKPAHALPAAPTAAAVASTPLATRAVADASSLSLSRQFQTIRDGGNGTSTASLQGFSFAPSSLVAGSGPIVPTGCKSCALPQDNPWDFFFTPNGTFGDIDPGQAGQQANFYSVGALAGIDYRLTKQAAVGFYAGYDYTKTTYRVSPTGAHDNTARFGLFSSWKDAGGDWLSATVGGAYHSIQVTGGAGAQVNAGSTDGMELDSTLEYGHDFKLGAWTLTPTAGLDYIRLAVDSFALAGPVVPVSYNTQVTNSLRSELGATLAYAIRAGSVKWTPYLRAGWNHEFLDDVASTQIASGAFVSNQPIGRETASFGAGVSAAFTPALSWSLDYAGEADSYYQSHSLQTAIHVAF